MRAFGAARTTRADRPRVVALCGSRREGSYTRRALGEALSGVDTAGGTGELLDLADVDLPPLDPDRNVAGDGEAVVRRIRDADAVVLGTPMYHGSYSGVLKNALDYCGFDEFENTTVGLLVVSGGSFPITALDHLRAVCRSLNAWVLPYQAAVPRARTAFDADEFVDDELRERVRTLGRRVVQYASIESEVTRAVRCREV